ncbi:unnamed protein product [Durusdinium trenchii]|uniref:BZIP domain-containing protein n=1 Tax=Durusdinium trenchii TaxID=1381693 RepID=A0ABP0S651_9DINO
MPSSRKSHSPPKKDSPPKTQRTPEKQKTYEENRRNLARYRLRPEEVEKIARHDELAAELASLKAHLKDAQVKLLLKKVHSLEQQLWFLKGQCKCSANSENGPLSVQHQEKEK